MIELNNVNKSFKGNRVLEDINLHIESGQAIGFVGGNGSGKSVLFSMIAGLLSADSGEIIVGGKRIGVDQDFPDDTGILINEPGYIGFYSGFKNLYYLSLIKSKISVDQIKEQMRKLNLDPENKLQVSKYSSGMKQKLGIIQAIMEDQRLLILDEPFNALDHRTYNEIMSTLLECKAEGKTILLTTHSYQDFEHICDIVYFLEFGRLKLFDEEEKTRYFLAR